MFNEGALYLKGADPVSGTLDHIVGSSHKPVVPVLIPPSRVPGMVDPILPDFGGSLRFSVISVKQPDRFAPIRPDHQFSYFSYLTGITLFINDINIITGSGFTHRPGLWFHPGKGGDRNSHL